LFGRLNFSEGSPMRCISYTQSFSLAFSSGREKRAFFARTHISRKA